MTSLAPSASFLGSRLPRGRQAPEITLYHPTSIAAFLADASTHTLVVDLVLGLVRPNAVSAQILQQLGLPLERHQGVDGLGASSASSPSADLIGPLIDKETFGYTPVLVAQSYVDTILDHVFRSTDAFRIVLLPPSDGQLGEENEYFLQFLAQQAADRIEVCAVCDKSFSPTTAWKVTQAQLPSTSMPAERSTKRSAVLDTPGIVSTEDAARLGERDPAAVGLLRLRQGFWLVPPELRPATRSPQSLALVSTLPDPWVKAYAIALLQQRQHLALLVKLGWTAITEGGQRVGLSLFESVKAMSGGPLAAAQMDSMILGTMIGLEEYAAVGSSPMPALSLPARLRGQLLQHKAWGCAMSGRLEEAQTIFEEARALHDNGHTTQSREYLYLLNITAFTHFRRKDIAGAFRLEKQMSEGIARLPKHDHHLDYINSMNTGRLYLLRGDAENAERFFERANATNNGLRTLADQLTIHVYRARVAELKNDAALAQLNWLQAALFWAAHPLPESLSARACRLLLGQALPARHLWTVQISQLFLTRLADLFPSSRGASADHAPTICNSEVLSDTSDAELIGSPEASVVVSHQLRTPARDDLDHRALRSALRIILSLLSNSPALATAPTLYLDDQYGTELPNTKEEAVGVALRLNLARATFTGEVVYQRSDARDLELIARLAPAIDTVKGDASESAVISFRRYRTARAYDGLAASIIHALAQAERTVDDLAQIAGRSRTDTLQTLRRLEKERVVRVSPRPSFCVFAPSTAFGAFERSAISNRELASV